MKTYKRALLLVNLLALIGYFHYAVAKKEALLESGKLILLPLAPVDPRSLMQGDYMQLRYAMAEDLSPDSIPKRGYCVVTLDSEGVASRARVQADVQPVQEGEYLIAYTASGWSLNIGAESYFFQEGQAAKYDSARYGGIRADREGHSVLVGLYDRHRQKIEGGTPQP